MSEKYQPKAGDTVRIVIEEKVSRVHRHLDGGVFLGGGGHTFVANKHVKSVELIEEPFPVGSILWHSTEAIETAVRVRTSDGWVAAGDSANTLWPWDDGAANAFLNSGIWVKDRDWS